MMERPENLKYDGPVLTEGAVGAIAILRALGRVNDGDELTPARICELIGCEEPDEHGLPPRDWLPELRDDIEDLDRRAAVAAVELVMRELIQAMNDRGGDGIIYAQALTQLAGNLAAASDLAEKVLHDTVRACYAAAVYEGSLH